MIKPTLTAGAVLAAIAAVVVYNNSSDPSAETASAESSPSAATATCGEVTIADMNWNSATLIAHVDRFILENGFGCTAKLVPGDTMPTSTSMVEKGEPDIAPEMWTNSMAEALEKGIVEKSLRLAGQTLSDGGEEGFWVPKYLVDADPSLKTIEGIKKNAKLFTHPENGDLSAFYTCPAGWNCQISSGNLFNAMDLEASGFDVVDPGSGAGLAGSIAKAYEQKEGWFGYYWAPTAVLGKYDMVKVDFGSGIDKDAFIGCITKEDCESPVVTMYPPSPVNTITTEEFAVNAPEAYAYLGARSFSNAQMNKLLAWMEDNQADGEIAMEYFLNNYESTWMQWLSAEAAANVKKKLSAL